MQNYIEAIEEQRQKNEPEKAGLFKKFESLSKIIDLLVKWAVWLAIVFGWLLGWLTSAFLS